MVRRNFENKMMRGAPENKRRCRVSGTIVGTGANGEAFSRSLVPGSDYDMDEALGRIARGDGKGRVETLVRLRDAIEDGWFEALSKEDEAPRAPEE